jgi:hypothetical protein
MKKILSLVLALLMSASAASFVGAAEEAAIAAEDTTAVAETTAAISDAEAEARAQYADALKLLDAWNILHGKGENNPAAADLIQRYEMALLVARISTGWTDDSKWAVADQWYDRDHNTSGFDDLEGSYAEQVYGALSYAAQKGIILGYGNRKFGPSDGITYQDCLTMAVRTLGYFNLAWPWGNIEKAVTLGLTKGIPSSVKYTDILNRGQVAQILYNALFAQTKDGDTLAARNFNGDLDWKTIIITVAGKGIATTDDDKALGLPDANFLKGDKMLGFKVVKADGTLEDTTYWVKNQQTFNFGDRLENYLGFAYKALFSKDADSNLVTIEACKSLEEETVRNWGVTDGNFPITKYLADYGLVSEFGKNTYLNNWNGNYGWYEFILKSANQGVSIKVNGDRKYGVDWENGHIVARVEKAEDADYTVKVGDTELYYKVAWHWNDKLKAYFQYVYKDVDGKLEVVGIDILDDADIKAMMDDMYLEETKTLNRGLKILGKDDTKTAYATLIPFALNDSPRANYGLFKEYRLGYYKDAKVKCSKDNNAEKDGFTITSLDALSNLADTLLPNADDWMKTWNTDWANSSISGIFEGSCDHGNYWINTDRWLEAPKAGGYVIYNINHITGEIDIVKIIYDITDEKHTTDDYVATGVVRGYNVPGRTVTIGEKTLSFDYNDLAGNGMKLKDPSKAEKRAEFTYFFKTLFNQYVTYVVCDGKLVYMELAGNSSDLIVVDSYAGLSSDGYIVVNGYDTKNLEYRQYRIGSYNGWVKGDYYYYPNQAEVDAAFVRGTLYTINSYDGDKDVYYVSTAALRYYNPDTGTLNYYVDELVQKGILAKADPITVTLNAGYKSFGGDYEKAKSTDKYILICNPIANFYGAGTTNAVDAADPHKLDDTALNGFAGGDYAPIIVYVGKGGTDWEVTGNPVKTGETTILLNVNYNTINGFDKDQFAISYVLFQTWDYEVANYDVAGSTGWYLLGASNYQARCFNLYTGEAGDYIAVNKDLRLGYAYPAIGKTIVNDIPYDAARLNYAVGGAYESGSKYVFGHGTIKDTLPDGTAIDYSGILWDADKVSQKILSYNTKLVPAKLGKEVKGLTTGTDVYLVSTYEGLYGATKIELDKIGKDDFAAWAKNLDLTTIYFWYVHNVGGKTIFYIQKTGTPVASDTIAISTKNVINVSNATPDYAYISSTIKGVADRKGITPEKLAEDLAKNPEADLDKIVAATFDTLEIEFIGQATGDTHHAIDTNDYHFGKYGMCEKEDWETKIVVDGKTYRLVGSITEIPYEKHDVEDACELIRAIEVPLNGQYTDGTKVYSFKDIVAPEYVKDADGEYVLDSNGKKIIANPVINFTVIVKDSNGTEYTFKYVITITANDDLVAIAFDYDATTPLTLVKGKDYQPTDKNYSDTKLDEVKLTVATPALIARELMVK